VEKKRIALLAIFCGLTIFALKLSAFLISGSMALLSDAMESIVNIVASVMLFAAISIAARPADENHRYGHEKAENISALVEGILILIAAVLIIEASVGRILNPVPLENVDVALLISLGATSINALLGLYMYRAGKKSHSIALEGDAKHLFSDVVSSVGVVVGLLVASLTGWFILDPLIALLVAFLLIWMGINVLRHSSGDLMDASYPEQEARARAIISRHASVLDCHDMKTRRSGRSIYLDCHVCVDAKTTVAEAHDLTERINEDLKAEIPDMVVNIHVETQEQAQKRASG
jgi:cation diffusion facilitator family transporter